MYLIYIIFLTFLQVSSQWNTRYNVFSPVEIFPGISIKEEVRRRVTITNLPNEFQIWKKKLRIRKFINSSNHALWKCLQEFRARKKVRRTIVIKVQWCIFFLFLSNFCDVFFGEIVMINYRDDIFFRHVIVYTSFFFFF